MTLQKVVVTTDLSVPSKAGIRFAIQYARLTKSHLIFYYCLDLLRPTRWNDQKFNAYKNGELKFSRERLALFVSQILEQTGAKGVKYECVVESGMDVAGSTIAFAFKKKAKAICISTRGGGRLKRIMGTNASKILTYSPLPVFIVPKTYRAVDISSIFYASDLTDLAAEFPRVAKVADALKAKSQLYHYSYHVNVNGSAKPFEPIVKKYKRPTIEFHFKPIVLDKSLADQVAKDVRKSKSSLVVVFANQDKSWFEKTFLSNQSAELAFHSKVPLLVIPKVRETKK